MSESSDNPRNIEIFNRIASFLLANLYRKFPNPVDLTTEEVAEAIHDGQGDQEELHEIMSVTVENSVIFLIRHGYLEGNVGYEYQCDKRPTLREMVLTEAGLRLLRSVPASLEGSETFGDRLVESVKGGTWGLAALLVEEIRNRAS